MNPLNYMRLHDNSSGNQCQYWTIVSNGKISFKPMILAYFLAGGNTRRSIVRHPRTVRRLLPLV